MVNILGVSAFYHDSAACLVRDGAIVAAAQEERFTRKKHDEGFPKNAVNFCLDFAGLRPEQIDHIGFYDKPLLTFERLLETYIDFAPRGFRSFMSAMPVWLTDKLWTREKIAREIGFEGKILFTEHHESHAASAFFPSPFERAAILTIDGVGEWSTSSYGIGIDNRIELSHELRFPHSVGLLYSAFTYFTGFKVNSGEYKLMGLAPYGEPVFVKTIIDNLVELCDDGSIRLNMEYFDFATGLTMTNDAFAKLFGGPPRVPESTITQREMDIARSIQQVTETIMLRMADQVFRQTGEKNLCLAGGCALNCVANGRILRETAFEKLWIQPAAGDAGGALGAALSIWHQYLGNERVSADESSCLKDRMGGAYLGPSFSSKEIRQFLDDVGAVYQELGEKELVRRSAREIAGGKVLGWFQGRMEFGPRALGSRSILGDPHRQDMQKQMNLKIKNRESFRPFAPAVLREDASKFFDLTAESPYMQLVAPVSAAIRSSNGNHDKHRGLEKLQVVRSTIPAVTHVDLSARIQTVDRSRNKRFFDLIQEFGTLTGDAVLINTSFNVRGEPIVCSPQEAFNCFLKTEMDALVMESFFVSKAQQNGTITTPNLTGSKTKPAKAAISDREARKTSYVVAGAFSVIAIILGYRGHSQFSLVSAGVSATLVILGTFSPVLAKIFHRAWISIAYALGSINSRIILTIVYFLVFVPYGLASRLVGRDPLKIRGPRSKSYWQTRDRTHQTREGFERLF